MSGELNRLLASGCVKAFIFVHVQFSAMNSAERWK
jgi:hypothetical protein